MGEPIDAPVIVGVGGASGKGWSELKDIECTRRYMYIKADNKKYYEAKRVNPLLPRQITQYDEAFQTGIFMHAARAYWLSHEQAVDENTLKECYAFAKQDCFQQGFVLSELNFIEYSLMFMRYASYWAIRPKVKPYAVEYFLEHELYLPMVDSDYYLRSTRLDDVGYYPDVGGYCIGEFKTTFDLSGSLKYYSAYNPQILMQWLLYKRTTHNGPEINGTMIDIWDKAKNKGTRHFIPFNEKLMNQYEKWVIGALHLRSRLLRGETAPTTNFLVCNTFNDAYKSQCAFKERCGRDD